MRKLEDVTLVVPHNDLESETIIKVVKKLGFSGDRLILMGKGIYRENIGDISLKVEKLHAAHI